MRGAMATEHSSFSVTLGLEKVFLGMLARFDRWRTEDQRQLADHLKKTIDLLKVVKNELKKGKVPHENGNALAALINLTARLAQKSKKRDVKLALIFEHELPKVGQLLREADFFIDGTSRVPHHYAVRKGVTTVDTKRKAIAEACKEIERAVGDLSAYAFSLENEVSKKDS
jgi:hypothetical protein